ncbi:MAG TPA: aspartate aminotransferase family protein, partial [Firmicutes bacterium]|nr:aspartate aminotransferase family protein [Bacillota bacterium]
MNNQEIIALTDRYLMSTYSRQPIALVRGEGTRVWDADGREYLDFVTGVAVNSLGHCHPKVVAAIREAAGRLIHCSNHYHIENQARLAAFLTAKAGMDRAVFMNSGAEAIEGAIKLARRYAKLYAGPERTVIISAFNSFHGRTLGALTATGQPKYHEGFEPLVPDFIQVPLNDVAALEKAVDGKTAAVLLEPIQGEGGVHPCTREYLQAARSLCTQAGIPLIFDEVQTGLGRTGKWFAFMHYEVKPDIIAIAKALGGGVPIGAVLAVEEVAQAFSPGTHGSTFGGGPLATSAALAAMQALEEEHLVEAAA